MESLIVYSYVMACGFALAGVLSSFVRLVSGEPMGFGLQPTSIVSSLGGVLLRVFAGPEILMRTAWRAMWMESRPKFWFGLSAIVAAWWSLFIGALLIDLVLKL
jgi:hypothetical protein